MEKENVKLNLHTLELNGIPIAEIMDFDPEKTEPSSCTANERNGRKLA